MGDLAAVLAPGGIEQLVTHLMSAEDGPRKNAEALFEQLKQQPDACAGSLLTVMRTSQAVDHRSFAAIMLRKALTRDDPTLWSKCSPTMQSTLKNELLLALKEEQQKTVVKKVCDTVTELGVELVNEKVPGGTEWPELLPAMFSCVQSGNPTLIECGLCVLGGVSSYMLDQLRPQLPALISGLGGCLAHANPDVQLAALSATSSFIQAVEDPAEREQFVPLLQPMMACLASTLNMGAEASAQEALAMFIEVAEAHPRFLRRNLADVVSAMLSITRAEQLEAGTRSLAAEFLVTLCEAREKAPGMMRKLPHFAANLFETLMIFLLDVEDDPLWHQADTTDHEEEGAGELYGFAQECLDRVAISLGGNAMVPVAGALLPRWLTDADWRKRHASLICLAQIAEGCQKVMLTQIEPLVDMCIKGLQDPSAKVRWAACQALGQMCTDLGPNIQEKCHAKILPALMAVMDDFNNPRVQAHASAAVVNFSEGADQEMLPPYLDVLITKLLVLLQHGKKLVQEGALTAMASVADCSNQLFIKYYDSVMPLLLSILVGANDKAHRLLRGKALECVSLVGMAVGRDRFGADAQRVLQWLQALQGTELDADDPTLGYMLQAGARLCKCLQDQFVPYLPIVMPPLLKSALVEPDIKITEAEDALEDDDEQEDMEHIRMGDKLVSIRTSSLEEKSTACSMLCCYADELKEGFFPYVKPVADIMVPLLKFWFHEDVRRAAVQTLPELLRCVVICRDKGLNGVDNNFIKQLLDYMWPAMMDALGKEPDADVQTAHLDSIAEIVELVDTTMLSAEQVQAAFTKFAALFKSCEEKRQERSERRNTEDFDEEELEALEEENQVEEEIFDQCGAAIGAFLKKFGDAVLPYVEVLMPQIGALLLPTRPNEDRRIAVCIIDDLLQHSAQGRAKYFGTALPILMEACNSTDPDLRQCAVYGLGVLAEKAPEIFRPYVKDALARVMKMIQQADGRNEDNEMATENAVSTLGKLLEYHSDALDSAAIASTWVNSLPLTADAVEAAVQHELLVKLLSAKDPRVLGPGNSHIPKIVSIAVIVLANGTRFISGENGLRLAQLLAGLQPPADAVQAELSKLKERQRVNFNTYMSGTVPAAADD